MQRKAWAETVGLGLLFTAAAPVMGTFAACLWWQRWREKPERAAKRALGVPAAHPERITGRVKASTRRELAYREGELAAAGIEAWQIADEYRRHP